MCDSVLVNAAGERLHCVGVADRIDRRESGRKYWMQSVSPLKLQDRHHCSTTHSIIIQTNVQSVNLHALTYIHNVCRLMYVGPVALASKRRQVDWISAVS